MAARDATAVAITRRWRYGVAMQSTSFWSHGVTLRPVGWTARDWAVVIAVAAVATLFPYHRGLIFPFALDDYTFLMQAAGLDPAPFSLRRWLTVRGYYEAMLAVFGPHPLPWHVMAFALHAAIAVAVGAWSRRFGATGAAAAMAAGIFAASPIAFTVMYWIACIQELASGAFLLLAAWFMVRTDKARWTAVPLFAAAVLCKEAVLTAPLALAVLFGRRTWRLASVMSAVGAALFLGSGLHTRMWAGDRALPYATDWGANLLVHLATQVVWSAAFWRPYPDRIPAPDAQSLLPALAVAVVIAVLAIIARGGALRAAGLASLWYVALLLPVLPLVQHAYAYYGYLPHIGFVIVSALAFDRATARWRRPAASPAPAQGAAAPAAAAKTAEVAAPPWGPALAAAAAALIVSGVALCAAQNARTHETLTLAKSPIPHDSVLRSAAAAGGIVRAVHTARLPPEVRRIAFFSFPETISDAALTPGAQPRAGLVRVRRFPLRDALRDGDLIALHFPGLRATWRDTLERTDEGPDTAIFFAAGFDQVEPLPDAVRAYFIQAQGRLLAKDTAGARRDLERVLALDSGNAPARVVLAGLELQAGRRDAARTLVESLADTDVPADLRPFLQEVRRLTRSGPG
jgi:hypothetical protein